MGVKSKYMERTGGIKINKFFRWYYYLFYQGYLWNSKPSISLGSPEQASMFGLAYACVFNILSALMLVQILGETALSKFFMSHGKLHYLLFLVVPIAFFHYYIFLYRKKYEKIIQFFDKKKLNKKRGAAIYWGYVFCTFLGFFLVSFIFFIAIKKNFTLAKYLQGFFK